MSNFQIEGYALPGWAGRRGITDAFPYHGPSMTPTFRDGDFVYVRPAACYFPGDVIVFRSWEDDHFIIHRVIACGEAGLTTRGDHNRSNDPPVLPGQVVGRVEFAETWRGLVRVWNGTPGLWLARFLWLWLGIDLLVRRLFWQPYDFIRQKRLAGLLWWPVITRVRFGAGEGLLVKYLYRGRTVAVWESASGKFTCRKPFDLVIPPPRESLSADEPGERLY